MFVGVGGDFGPVLEEAVGHETVEAADFTSVLVADNLIHAEIGRENGTVAAEFDGLVPYSGKVDTGGVAEIAGAVVPVYGEFPSGCLHLSDVHGYGAVPVGIAQGEDILLVVEHIVGFLPVDVEGQVETGVEDADVETEVEVLDGFPFEFVVSYGGDGGSGDADAADDHVAGIEQGQVGRGIDVLVTHAAPSQTELEVVDEILAAHEGFVADAEGKVAYLFPFANLEEPSTRTEAVM